MVRNLRQSIDMATTVICINVVRGWFVIPSQISRWVWACVLAAESYPSHLARKKIIYAV